MFGDSFVVRDQKRWLLRCVELVVVVGGGLMVVASSDVICLRLRWRGFQEPETHIKDGDRRSLVKKFGVDEGHQFFFRQQNCHGQN